MFTGIIQDLGIIHTITSSTKDASLGIATKKISLENSSLGDSIAVNGVCLTMTRIDGNIFYADVSHETLSKTTLNRLKIGQSVNLEKALTLSTPLGGHMVSGHVDGVAKLVSKIPDGNSTRYQFSPPQPLMKYISEKGSITISGISLTVNHIDDQQCLFSVSIIPHTETLTNLGELALGDEVNLEIDLIARYLERLISGQKDTDKNTAKSQLSIEQLRELGF